MIVYFVTMILINPFLHLGSNVKVKNKNLDI